MPPPMAAMSASWPSRCGPGRSDSEVVAWTRMESSLNVVLAGTSIWMICPYDARVAPLPDPPPQAAALRIDGAPSLFRLRGFVAASPSVTGHALPLDGGYTAI